jgi:hypothetical protein
MSSISHFICPAAERGSHIGICAVCGFNGEGQYRRDEVLDIATSNVTALFELTSDCICAPCLALWSKPKHWHRGILATEGRVRFPVISAESATADRPTWAVSLRELSPGEPRAIVLTTDAKKRVWPFARVSAGDTAWLYLHDPSRGVSENRAVSLSRLNGTLALIESVYEMGFTKSHIAKSLFPYQKLVNSFGLPAIVDLDRKLAQIRNEPEFLPALIVAQKETHE